MTMLIFPRYEKLNFLYGTVHPFWCLYLYLSDTCISQSDIEHW
jgi:hypothetical protein